MLQPGYVESRVQHAATSPSTQSWLDTVFWRMQDCASQVLGRIPIVFPQCYHDESLPWLARVWAWLKIAKLHWNPQRGRFQWWIDAVTIEAPKQDGGQAGMGVKGVGQPILQTKLANCRPGSMPAVMVYVAVHPQYGCKVWFPYNGAKGKGGAKKNKPGQPWEGFETWLSTLPQEKKDLLVDLEYFNHPDTMDKKVSKAKRKEMQDKSAFTPENFLVWSLMLGCMHWLHRTAATQHMGPRLPHHNSKRKGTNRVWWHQILYEAPVKCIVVHPHLCTVSRPACLRMS